MAFFEQLGKKITDAGQGATQQAKNFAEVTRLNSAISDKEKQISQIFTEIGQSYYENHKSDPQAEDIERITAINMLDAEMRQCREKIKKIKGVTKCPNCGEDVPFNAAFCNACGAKIPPTEPMGYDADSEPTVLCPMCGKPVSASNLFCNHCGAKLDGCDK